MPCDCKRPFPTTILGQKEAQTKVGVEMVEMVADALRGVDFRNLVNPKARA